MTMFKSKNTTRIEEMEQEIKQLNKKIDNLEIRIRLIEREREYERTHVDFSQMW